MQRNPRAVETAEGERQTTRSSGAPEARYLKGSQKVKRESRDKARVKPSKDKARNNREKAPRLD